MNVARARNMVIVLSVLLFFSLAANVLMCFSLAAGQRRSVDDTAGDAPRLPAEPPAGPPPKVQIVTVSERAPEGTLQIFLRDFDGSNPVQLTRGPRRNWMPSFSPDGKSIAYVSMFQTSADIFLMKRDGSEEKRLTHGGKNITPTWIPDGKQIAFTHSPSPMKVRDRIYLMDADGRNRKRLTRDNGDFSELCPTVSPDGKHIAFGSDRSGRDKFEIWRVKVDGTDLRRLTRSGYSEEIGASIQQKVPSWSPDGGKIAFWQGVEMAELKRDGGERDRKIMQSWKVCVMDSDGSGPVAVDFGDDPCWTADSRHVVHPDPLNRDRLRPVNGAQPIAVKKHLSDGRENTTMFVTSGGFGRMSITYK